MVQRDRGRVVLYKFSVVEGDSGARGGCVCKSSVVEGDSGARGGVCVNLV